MKRKRRQLSKADREKLISIWGNKCRNCGSTENIEWHHLVPLEIGGYDTLENLAPLCRTCHVSVTHHEMLLSTVGRVSENKGGRHAERPDNCDAIFEDYVRCRIPKSIAAERLGKGIHFVDMSAFRKFCKDRKIVERKNKIDLMIACHGKVLPGEVVGYVKYEDGTVEEMIFGNERPKTGEFNYVHEEKKRVFKNTQESLEKHKIYQHKLPVRKEIVKLSKAPEECDFDDSRDWWEEYRRKYLV